MAQQELQHRLRVALKGSNTADAAELLALPLIVKDLRPPSSRVGRVTMDADDDDGRAVADDERWLAAKGEEFLALHTPARAPPQGLRSTLVRRVSGVYAGRRRKQSLGVDDFDDLRSQRAVQARRSSRARERRSERSARLGGVALVFAAFLHMALYVVDSFALAPSTDWSFVYNGTAVQPTEFTPGYYGFVAFRAVAFAATIVLVIVFFREHTDWALAKRILRKVPSMLLIANVVAYLVLGGLAASVAARPEGANAWVQYVLNTGGVSVYYITLLFTDALKRPSKIWRRAVVFISLATIIISALLRSVGVEWDEQINLWELADADLLAELERVPGNFRIGSFTVQQALSSIDFALFMVIFGTFGPAIRHPEYVCLQPIRFTHAEFERLKDARDSVVTYG